MQQRGKLVEVQWLYSTIVGALITVKLIELGADWLISYFF